MNVEQFKGEEMKTKPKSPKKPEKAVEPERPAVPKGDFVVTPPGYDTQRNPDGFLIFGGTK